MMWEPCQYSMAEKMNPVENFKSLLKSILHAQKLITNMRIKTRQKRRSNEKSGEHIRRNEKMQQKERVTKC